MITINKPVVIYITIALSLALIIICKPAFPEPSSDLNTLLLNYGIQLKKEDSLPVIKELRYGGVEKKYHTIIAQNNKMRIEMEIVMPLTEGEAQSYSSSKYIIINGLYAPQIIPYTGALTTTTDCPADKKPKERTVNILGKPEKVLLANATERYVLGVWEDELIKQKAVFTVFFKQENNALFQVIIFKPIDSFNLKEVLNILQSLETINTGK